MFRPLSIFIGARYTRAKRRNHFISVDHVSRPLVLSHWGLLAAPDDGRAQLAATHRNPAFDVAVPTLNLGCLTAGDNPNRICDHADLQIDLRLLPGMDTAATISALEIRLARSAEAHGTSIKMRPVSPPVSPFSTPSDGKLVRALERLSGTTAGTVAPGQFAAFDESLLGEDLPAHARPSLLHTFGVAFVWQGVAGN